MNAIKYSLLINLLTVLASCTSENIDQEPVTIEKDEEAIHQVMDNWHRAAAEAEFEPYFSAMDSNAVFIGTDPNENWSKKEFMDFAKPYFEKGEAWDFKTLERNIYFGRNNRFAWFDELLDTWMGVCRGSGVVEFHDNKWKIKHYVLSVTVPNESMDQVIKVKKEMDSAFLNKYQEAGK